MDDTHSRSIAVRDEEFVSLADLVRFFQRQWLAIFGTALATAVVVVLVAVFVLPPGYEASATLVVVPSRFDSELKPEALSVHGYQRLLESDAVIGETIRRLKAKGVVDPGVTLRRGEELTSRIFVSHREEETTLAPVIEAVGRAASGEQAAAIANTWAEVFLESNRDLVSLSLAPTIALVEDQYASERSGLENLAQDRVDKATSYARRIDDTTLQWDRRLNDTESLWDRKLVDFRKETEDRIAAFQSETREVMESYAAARGLPVGDGEPAGGSAGGVGEAGDPGLDRRLAATLRQLVTLRIQLAQSPQLLVLEKSISDDALWQALALSQAQLFDLGSVADRKLLTQETNPVHSELTLKVSAVSLELETMLSTVAERAGIEATLAGLEKLQRERSTGLAKLIADRDVSFDQAQREKKLAIEQLQQKQSQETQALADERDLALQQLDREIKSKANLFSVLAEKNNQAVLAKAEKDYAYVRLGSPATPAIEPVPRRLGLKILVAMIVGLFGGLVLGIFRDVSGARSDRP